MRSSFAALVLCASLLSITGVASAQTGDAAELVSTGERARQLGQYGFAAHAFRQAQEMAPDHALLFAIADAYHQRFVVKREAYDRVQAIAYYLSYLDTASQRDERERAGRALAQLEASESTADEEELASAATAEMGRTRLAVTSPALGAVARIDGGKAQKLPIFSDIEPGKHTITISAPGYRHHQRKLTTVRGLVHSVHAALAPQPAKLSVSTTTGAQVYLDDELLGVAPLDEHVDVEPGTRRLSVRLTGHEPHSEQVVLKRGAAQNVTVDLRVTEQRIAASLLFAGGSVGLAAGIVFGVLSVVDHRAANALPRNPLNRTADQQSEYEQLIESRDNYRIGSGLAAGIGLGALVVGGALFILDDPDVRIRPQVGWGIAGATFSHRF